MSLRTVICSVCAMAVFIYIFHSLSGISFARYFKKISRLHNKQLEVESIKGILYHNASACRLYFQFGGFQEDLNTTRNFCETIDGQKAVCLDANLAPPSGVCVIYSFGLSASLSFERAMTSYGCDVYAFDRSVHQTKKSSSYQHLHLFSMGLGSHAAKMKFKGGHSGNRKATNTLV